MNKTPRAVLFDLDGTLADTAPDLAAAVNRLRIARGLEPTPYEQLRPVASAGARGLVGAAFGVKPGDAEFEALRDEFLASYEANLAAESRLFDGVAQLLTHLEQQGIAWGVVTNKAGRYTNLLVPQIGLGHAGCVISGDTTPHPKPHPEPLFEAARRLKLEPQQCWYVGDDLRDIQAGQAAGMTTVAAAWGYCGHSEPPSWNADLLADTPLHLIKFLQAL
jgi:phosphoglycolate phosphatase